MRTQPIVHSSKAVFLVEDDEDDQYFFIEALSAINNATLYGIANNGQEALEKLAKAVAYPDIIFIDINMPIMDGIECLTHIRKNPLTKDIAVVVLSSASEHFEIISNLGIKAFIKKPSDCQILRNNIEQIINYNFVPKFQIANQW